MNLDIEYTSSKLEHISLKYLGIHLEDFSKIDYSKLNWYGKIITDVINNFIIDSNNFKPFNDFKYIDNRGITILEYMNILKDAFSKFNKDLASYLRVNEEEIIRLLNIKILLKIEGINTSIQSKYNRIQALEVISNNNHQHLTLQDDIMLCTEEINGLLKSKNELITMYQDIKHISEMYDKNLQRKK